MTDDARPPGPEDQPDWSSDTLHVPDDIAELDADVLAFRREDRARRRRQRAARLLGWGRLRGYGVSVPLVLVAALVVAGGAALLVLLGPSTSRTPLDPSIGRPGGSVLPALLATPDGTTVPATSLADPSAVLLVPPGCACEKTVRAAVDAAAKDGVPAYVVEPTPAAAKADVGTYGDRATALVDRSGTLLAQYGSLGAAPTLLRLDATGTVRSVRTGLTAASAAAALSGS